MGALSLLHDVHYPESDGRPLGETDLHRDEIFDLINALKNRYRDRPDVYVTGNLFLYYARGNPKAVVCPDVFLVKGVPKGQRRTYKLWEEGRSPSLVIEVTSESTRDEDLIEKKAKYLLLGVEEYILYDPLDEYLSPALQGFRLAGGRYRPIKLGKDGSLASETTGLVLRRENDRLLRLVDPATGERLPHLDEIDDLWRAAEARAAAEAEARRAAEEELARLRRQLTDRDSTR